MKLTIRDDKTKDEELEIEFWLEKIDGAICLMVRRKGKYWNTTLAKVEVAPDFEDQTSLRACGSFELLNWS